MKEEKLILSSKLDETTHKISCDYGSLWLLKLLLLPLASA